MYDGSLQSGDTSIGESVWAGLIDVPFHTLWLMFPADLLRSSLSRDVLQQARSLPCKRGCPSRGKLCSSAVRATRERSLGRVGQIRGHPVHRACQQWPSASTTPRRPRSVSYHRRRIRNFSSPFSQTCKHRHRHRRDKTTKLYLKPCPELLVPTAPFCQPGDKRAPVGGCIGRQARESAETGSDGQPLAATGEEANL